MQVPETMAQLRELVVDLKLHFLLVTDQRDNVLSEQLTAINIQVSTTHTGTQALRQHKDATNINVIFIDGELSDMRRAYFVKKLRAQAETIHKGSALHCVMVTTLAAPPDEVALYNTILKKPVRFADLRTWLQSYLRGKLTLAPLP